MGCSALPAEPMVAKVVVTEGWVCENARELGKLLCKVIDEWDVSRGNAGLGPNYYARG